MQRKHFTRLIVLTFVSYGAFPARAQSTKAELFGAVFDPSGLPVEGAAVQLQNTGTQATSKGVTGADGGYHFFALPAGNHQITVSKEGFANLRRDGIVLRVGDRVSVDLALQVGMSPNR